MTQVFRQSRFHVMIGGLRLHYLEFGSSGPNVVVIPGITSPAETWSFVAERLAEFARVYVMDCRGRGLSNRSPSMSYGLDDYAGDVVGLIRELSLRRPVLLGHSVGGRVAIRIAASFSEDISRAILVDPPVTGPGRRPYPLPLKYYLDNWDAAVAGRPIPAPPTWSTEQIDARAKWLPTCCKEAIECTYASMHEEDVHSDLAKVTVPMHLIYAERGGTISAEEAAELAEIVPSMSQTLMPGVGHMIPWDDRDGFLRAVTPMISAE